MVIERDPKAVQDGLNLYVSGHAAEAVLMDVHGRTLHRWRYPLRRLWPDLAKDPAMAKLEYWRRAYLYPNGDLLGIYEGLGLVKLDARSRVLWAHRGGTHHDLSVRRTARSTRSTGRGRSSPGSTRRRGCSRTSSPCSIPPGRVRRRISILECFERSPYASLLRRMPRSGDIFHTNTLEVLDGRFADRDPAFRKGNLLISRAQARHPGGARPGARGRSSGRGPGGGGASTSRPSSTTATCSSSTTRERGRGRSRVAGARSAAPARSVWQYGGTPDADLFSKTLGSCQRLPNGNTLITESENGRALEVTRDHRVVWEFYNPHRAGSTASWWRCCSRCCAFPADFPFRGRELRIQSLDARAHRRHAEGL